ncbi:uncharacterized protein HD556DRAFT_1305964 [Suillus plorans]|uniref:Uncharacterized protein n=1 Tax=Suillus plorans TaxID=116603 RepID=A0A9P7J0T5_9AGAM|nr:uncharacterized protein HD556DRAFT_1305964 [Suillus plorans]KAG1798502.1 hypothetical protein HD556DRAFT_1305964 [Suillus plorans]
MLQCAAQWKSPLHLIWKGKGSRDSKKDNLIEGSEHFSIYLGQTDYSTVLVDDQMQYLLRSAQDVLLHSNNSLRHLATMTFGESNPAAEELADRMNQIMIYLRFYPPDVRNLSTPGTPWQALSVEMRQALPFEFLLSLSLFKLIQKSTATNRNQSLVCLFSTITIIHELAHIVMYTFTSQDTSLKFHGNMPLEADAKRGEAGASIETVMIGGEAFLATPSRSTIQTVDPSHVIIVVATTSEDDQWKILDENTVNLTDIASGNWSHISDVPIQPFPSNFSLVKPESSDVKLPSFSVPSSSYVVWVPPSSIPGVKY